MKLYLKILLIFSFLLFSYNSANASEQAEYECFKILHKYTKDYIYNGETFYKDMQYTILNNQVQDLSDYGVFKQNRIQRSKGSKFFRTRRNNIGTIRTENNYLISQVVTFGAPLSNMEFPLQIRTGESDEIIKSEGDPYTQFNQHLIFTHHVIDYPDYPLSSCGYLKIIPYEEGNYDSVNSDFWYVNGAKEYGAMFEIEGSGTVAAILGTGSTNHKFLIGKTRVPALDMDQNPLFFMDIMLVTYDNGSSLFNEYQTFPYQVRAMLNMDSAAQQSGETYSAQELSEEFLGLVQENTCLKVPHGKRENLPAECNNQFQAHIPSTSGQTSFLENLFYSIIPPASASIPVEEIVEEFGTGILSSNEEETSGTLIKGAIPLKLVQKLRRVPDSDFQNFILASVADNTEDYLNFFAGTQEYANYAKVFTECGITYEEKKAIVIDYLTKLNPEEWDVNNLTYSNPRFGDCIIPYPDKTHINQVISGSFLVNQERARIILEATNPDGDFTPKESTYSADQIKNIQTIDTLRYIYNQRISTLNKTYNEGNISEEEYNSTLESLIAERDMKIADLMQEEFSFSYSRILGIIFIFVGIGIIIFLLRRRKK